MGEAFIVRKGGVAGEFEPVFDNIIAEPGNLAFIDNVNYGGPVQSIAGDNDFVYVSGVAGDVKKYTKTDLNLVGNTNNYGGVIFAVQVDNDFIYAGGNVAIDIKKYHKGNLVFVGNSNAYGLGVFITEFVLDNDFIYVGGSAGDIKKYHKGNLVFVGNTNSYGGTVRDVQVDNDFIYVGGGTANTVKKWHKGNLAFVDNSISYGGSIESLDIDNEFVYVGGSGVSGGVDIKKYHKGNLVFDSNSNVLGTATIDNVRTDNSFVYASDSGDQRIIKYFKNNFTFVGNTIATNRLRTIFPDDDFIYSGGLANNFFFKYQNGIEGQTRIVFENDVYVKEE
jgi:hypothetical protein